MSIPPRTPTSLVTRTGIVRPDQAPTEALLREAAELVVALGIEVSASRLRRLVRRFVATSRPGDSFAAWFIAYPDPTGETAVRNVMAEAGR